MVHQLPHIPRQVRSNGSRLLHIDTARFILDRPIAVMSSDLDKTASNLVDNLAKLKGTANVAFGRRGLAVGDKRGGAFEGFEAAWASVHTTRQ